MGRAPNVPLVLGLKPSVLPRGVFPKFNTWINRTPSEHRMQQLDEHPADRGPRLLLDTLHSGRASLSRARKSIASNASSHSSPRFGQAGNANITSRAAA